MSITMVLENSHMHQGKANPSFDSEFFELESMLTNFLILIQGANVLCN